MNLIESRQTKTQKGKTKATKLSIMLGSKGEGKGQFQNPFGIAHDANNHRVLVSDSGNHRVEVFDDRNRQYLNEFGSFGRKNGQFRYPNQLCVLPITNHIVVADFSNHRVQIFNPQFQFVTIVGQDVLHHPQAVDCSHNPVNNSQQQIVAADYQHQIHIFLSSINDNHEYKLLRSFCSHGNNPDQTKYVSGLCCDDERKRILIADCDNRRLSVWSADGSQFLHTILMPNNQEPVSVCVDRYGRYPHHIVVGINQSQIHIFDARKEHSQQPLQPVETIGSQGKQHGQFSSYVCGVCIDEDGALLAADYDNHSVQIFSNHRSSLMLRLLSDHSPSASRHHPQQQQHDETKDTTTNKKQTVNNDNAEAQQPSSVYASFVNQSLFDRYLVREIAAFLPIYWSGNN